MMPSDKSAGRAAAPAANAPAATPPTAAGPGPAPGAAAARPASPLKPFADVVKDASASPGYFKLWRKDDKVWIELTPEQLDKPFFMSVNLSRGLGERMLFAGLMGNRSYGAGGNYLVEFRRIGDNVQLIARNTKFVATPGSPEARAVKNAFSDSLLSTAPVASLPNAQSKAFLIDANALLLADIPRGSHAIEAAYRNVYAFDRPNSFFADIKSNAERTTIDVTAHYAQARIPLPSPIPSPTPFFAPPQVVEDPRSLFLGFLYTFTKLPEQPMAPRIADARIGHFVTTQVDFSHENQFSPRRFLVNRWRLEKKDPNASLSEPIKPIVYWLDREIPLDYRAPIREGILEWNKAFERIGFKDAIVVKQQPDDADFDTGDALHASIKWFTTATPSFGAIGPSHVDPRTGEILDADIGWDSNQVRNVRFFRTEVPNARGHAHYEPMYDERTGEIRHDASALGVADQACTFPEAATREAGFAMSLLDGRGELDPQGPEAVAFVAQFLKDVTMHEVGHTLGLRHNFRASTIYTPQQLADRDFTAKNGLTGSVMEYTPINLALRSEKRGDYFTSTLGPYDYWAIEYAYKPIAPDRETQELQRIASRSSEPYLAFATDGDVREGLDPAVNQGDLGNDPLAFYRKRWLLTRELWSDLERRQLKDGESFEVLQRRFMLGFTQVASAMGLAAKYVGGMTAVADKAGSARAPLTPVAAEQQRTALTLLSDVLFRSDSFQVSPEFLRKLVRDRLEIENANGGAVSDLPVGDLVIAAQRDVLNRLMSPVVAQHLQSNAMRSSKSSASLSLAELYGTLQSAIWSEARAGAEVDPLRRNLQREHLRRVTSALLAPSAALPADARSVLRFNARQLRDQLAVAVKRSTLSADARVHYAEAYETLDETLKAPLMRTGT